MTPDKKNPYKSYKQVMSTASDTAAPNRWKLFFIKGNSDFLVSFTAKFLKDIWQKTNWNIQRLEGSEVNHEAFFQAGCATSLFEPKLATFIHNAHQITDIISILASVKNGTEIQNPIVFVWKGKDPSAKIQKELNRIGPLLISCDEPSPWELKEFIQDRCKYHSLKLNRDAQDLLLESTGNSLFKIENEIERISLTFHAFTSVITRDELAPHLDFLRDDHVFKIDQLLCQEAYEKVLLLIQDLTEKGESPLGLLAVISMHCRKALSIQSALRQGLSQAEISREIKLPSSVVQAYVSYVQKRREISFKNALKLCHEADRKFKSRSLDEALQLSMIVLELSKSNIQSNQMEL
jgi:DNA polymerase III delta subunit